MIEFLKVIALGIIEGVSEWLPISSTGHLILANDFIKLNVTKEFMSVFNVVIQLGAIFAVILLFWNKIFPFKYEKGKGIKAEKEKFSLWGKVLIACIPAGIIGVLFDDKIEELFYNPTSIAIALIVVGIIFLIVENMKVKKSRHDRLTEKKDTLDKITVKDSLKIGIYQVFAAVFPGTSRSGATIIGGMVNGLNRETAAEFTFILAIPVMLGASLLKIVKFGFHFSKNEMIILLLGMFVSFIVSLYTIKYLLKYIKKHDFKPFGIYRIILGIIILLRYYVF